MFARPRRSQFRRSHAQPENPVVRVVFDYCMVRRIYAERMNAGAAFQEDEAGNRYHIRLHTEGISDVLCFPYVRLEGRWRAIPLWVECKASAKSRVRPAQKSFCQRIEELGMDYLIVWELEQLQAWMEQTQARGGLGQF